MSAPTRDDILKSIKYHLDSAKSWGGIHGDFLVAAKHQIKAEVMIELIESHDCGSIGGFDPEDPKYGKHGDVYSRYEWIKRKHKS